MVDDFEPDVDDELKMVFVCYWKLGETEMALLTYECAVSIRERLSSSADS